MHVAVILLMTVASGILGVYEGEVVVRIGSGGEKTAMEVAEELGMDYVGPVLGFPNTYIFTPNPLFDTEYYPSHQKRGMEITKRLAEDDRITWAEPQTTKQRYKRDYIEFDFPAETSKRPPNSRYERMFNDDLWSQEWYLQDTRTKPDLPKLDLNVLPVYKAGITGRGIRISILDDGIEYTHEDLRHNYDPAISWDCNEEDDDPMPRYEPTKSNSHGTRCAGEVAMAANNRKCGVGIAYNAKIGGVKLLDGLVNDRVEGTALSYAPSLVDIYSASWGPSDDGRTVDGPGKLAKEAMERGIKYGRNGQGSIYVWASGNGGSKYDNCNCDGYLSSIYTISIGSASQHGEFPWYGEACASTLAVTYSSGAYKDQMIVTTDLRNECTIKHTGTSASAPLAAGIIALGLEVNPGLSWRDVQHLIVWTSELAPVLDNPGWQMNSAGFWFNTRFGFGLMNAFGFVKAAANWTEVPEKSVCRIQTPWLRGWNSSVAFGYPFSLPIWTDGCEGEKNYVRILEHVEVVVNIEYSLRGSLEAYLTSPTGTRVQLLSPRKLDDSPEGFINWTFMSVMTWGEYAAGLWILEILDKVGPAHNRGSVGSVELVLHGTTELPKHMGNGMRTYNEDYNRIVYRKGRHNLHVII